jgi:AcrR family transcriptional regulator
MKKGEITKEKILGTAIEVFREGGFDNGSILKIASKMGVRSSTIYYYFKNKDEIYNALGLKFKDGIINRIKASITKGKMPIENINEILKIYLSHIKENAALYETFREVEFVNLDLAKSYYKDLTDCIKDALKGQVKENFDIETLAFAIVGSMYFNVINSLFWNNRNISEKEIDTIFRFIKTGIDKRLDFLPYLIAEKRVEIEEKKFSTRGEKTKTNIIKAAEKLFGKNGYAKTQITDIARSSNIGLGTIYIYFKSKREILSEVIKYVNHVLRSCSWEYTNPFKDRREIENAGFNAFFYAFKNRGDDYRIVREAEFVDKEIGSWYYTRIADSYKRGLDMGIKAGEINDLDPETLSYSLMGIGHTVGIKWFVIEKNKKVEEKQFLTVLNFIMQGLKGILKEESWDKSIEEN